MDSSSPAPTSMLELEPELSVPLNANLEFQIHSKDVGEGRNAFLSIFKWTSSPMALPMWSAKSALDHMGASLRHVENSPAVQAQV